MILANVTAPLPQPPPPPPPNSQQVSFAEKGTDGRGWFSSGSPAIADDSGWDTGADPEPFWTSSEEQGDPNNNNNNNSNNKSRNVVVDPATGDVDFGQSIKSSWSIFGRGDKGKKNGEPVDGLRTIEEDVGMGREWEKEREKERVEREAEEKRRCEETDAQRVREITSKAVSAILLGLLKWFRVSREFQVYGASDISRSKN